jgi:lipid-A-disaccharide synthase
MPNILLNEEAVPELIQDQFTVERLVSEANRVLENPEHALAVRLKLARVRELLGRPGVIERAARLILREAGLAFEPALAQPVPAPARMEDCLDALNTGAPA